MLGEGRQAYPKLKVLVSTILSTTERKWAVGGFFTMFTNDFPFCIMWFSVEKQASKIQQQDLLDGIKNMKIKFSYLIYVQQDTLVRLVNIEYKGLPILSRHFLVRAAQSVERKPYFPKDMINMMPGSF